LSLLILFWMLANACANYPSGPDSPSTKADYATKEDTQLTVAAKKGVLAKDDTNDTGILKITSAGTMDTENGGQLDLKADGGFIYIPPENFSGVDSCKYNVKNQADKTFQAVLSVAVTPVNDSPTAKDDSMTVEQGGSGTVHVLANDSDIDGDKDLSVSEVGKPINGTAENTGSGVVSYTPNSNFNGDDAFTYTLSDGNGGKATGRVMVAVKAGANSLKANADSFTTPEEVPIDDMDVLSNDVDPQGGTITIESVVSPTRGGATVTIKAGNTLSYVPARDFFGQDSFSYTISTPDGSTSAATVTVTVTEVSDLPVAVDDSLTTAENTPYTIDVLANDSDPDDDILTVTAVEDPQNGTAIINDDDTITYTPDEGFAGSDSFVYTLTAGDDSVTAEVTVTVTGSSHAPDAVDDAQSTAQDTPVAINVLANDTDPDGDLLTVTDVTQPVNGSVINNLDGTVTYTPNVGFSGIDSFAYIITDGVESDQATVTVTVVAATGPPDAVDDAPSTAQDTPVAINVLANDTDPDGDSLTVTDVTQPVNGSVVNNNDGTVTYTPNTGFFGSDSFTYTITDGFESDQATVTVTVTPLDVAPVAVDDSLTIVFGIPGSVNVLANDSDANGDAMAVTSVTQPLYGSVSVDPLDNATITYTPGEGFPGSDSFSYTVTANGLSDEGLVIVGSIFRGNN
jgi:hypothetical protein